jgi:type IV pilus assembly protein PilB
VGFTSPPRCARSRDPDVVMVAKSAFRDGGNRHQGQTGHLVMSTLHTNDAPQTLTRLVDMGDHHRDLGEP